MKCFLSFMALHVICFSRRGRRERHGVRDEASVEGWGPREMEAGEATYGQTLYDKGTRECVSCVRTRSRHFKKNSQIGGVGKDEIVVWLLSRKGESANLTYLRRRWRVLFYRGPQLTAAARPELITDDSGKAGWQTTGKLEGTSGVLFSNKVESRSPVLPYSSSYLNGSYSIKKTQITERLAGPYLLFEFT